MTAPHPLLGKWTWTRGSNNCTEIYDFRPDGTSHVQSGTEISDGLFMVSPEPNAAGFYVWTDQVTKDFGGRDCANSEDDSTGRTSTVYVQISPRRRDQIIVCYTAALDRCFGPLTRVRE
jgi:hypothetical protein